MIVFLPQWAFVALIVALTANACASLYKSVLLRRLAQRQDGRIKALMTELRGVRDLPALDAACDRLDSALHQ